MPSNLPQLLSFSSLLFTLYTAASAGEWYVCSTTNSTAHSTYRSNLQLLLPSLSSAAVPTGFSAQSRGRPPNQVFGSALCRGDVSQSECQFCLSSVAKDMPQLCPSSRRGAFWYDTCFLYYSTGINVTSSKDNETIALKKQRWLGNTGQNASNPGFAVLSADLMASLIKRAAYGSALLFATGEVNVTSSERLYGLVQCTRDQSDDDCNQCLQRSMEYTSTYSPRSVGAETLAYSCYMRHDMYAFYDESVGAAPPPLPVPVPVAYSNLPPSTGKESENEDEEINDVKDLLFGLGTLRVATDNFSEMNKLGEGGFGPVYKVWEHWRKDMALQIIDHSLGELYHRQEALTCIHIGLLCVQEDSRKRPCMESVVLMLSNCSIALPTPSMPAYFVPSRAATDSNVTSRIADSSRSLSSIHNMSITEIEPR
ncbi:putative Cysteine-rich repeat secretory protein 38 [Cocos nucifera]|uniref:Putative Cysteine-rich repeat secretory protein 38 n=1 Tax=Cocos nucifera TaxID=13894 RepID=A0A8K0NCG6_COCNU|nr:putative Cysteine-rich repeat secretory protein 38 [Cocos nucifera]